MLTHDARHALRGLWHAKAFAAVAIVCLGFGIGLNTTIFSVVDGVLLRPLPYTDPDRIAVLNSVNSQATVNPQTGQGLNGLSLLDLRDWKAESTAFAAIAGVQNRSLAIADGGEPERYSGGLISWDLFPMLGVSPVKGRGFRAEDDRPGAPGVVLLSYAVWTTRYHNDPAVVGRHILVNAAPAVIVGVMPQGFEFPDTRKLWMPITPVASNDARGVRPVFVAARLRPGMSIAQAQGELSAVSGRLAHLYPETNENWGALVRPLRAAFIPADVTMVISLMMAGVTLVLIIACSNVANLMLSRAASRQREIAVRTALGAGRGRVVRQMLTESVVLSLVSLPLGVLLAEAGTRLIAWSMPADGVPYYIRWEVDWRSLLYTVAVAVGTAIVFGAVPALQATRGNLHEALKEGTRGNSARRSLVRSGFVVAQVSLALVALVGALVFIRSFANLDAYNFGYDVKPLMTMRYFLAGEPYDPPGAKLRRVQDIVERVETLPGVVAAFSSNFVPMGSGGGGGEVVIDGQPPLHGPQAQITLISATPHINRTLGLSVRGRDFTPAEGYARQPVAIVNESMAARFWPGREAIGGRFRINQSPPDKTAEWFAVIGVMPDARLNGVAPSSDPVRPTAFVPYAYQEALNTGLTIRVAGGSPAAVTSGARDMIRAADSNLPVFQVTSGDDLRRLNYWMFGLYGWVFGAIGVVGLLLAAVGVYGVLSYSVSQRTQEVGVRMALGAGGRQVRRLIVGEGLRLGGIGVAIGLVLAPLGTMAARRVLFEVGPFDPVSFTGVASLLLAVAALASYLPARRATRVDPVVALRGE